MDEAPLLSSVHRVPHTGWTRIETSIGAERELVQSGDFYFSHSFIFDASSMPSAISASYQRGGSSIVAAVEQGNVFGVQFHPEKSGDAGLDLIDRFAKLAIP
jgi:glutamine amidotransferase